MSLLRRSGLDQQARVLWVAIVLVPIAAFALLAAYVYQHPGEVVMEVLIPAVVGVCISLCALQFSGLTREQHGDASRTMGPLTWWSIVIAAVGGVLGNALPQWVNSLISGIIIGFFSGFAFLLVRLRSREAGSVPLG